jgi:Y-X(10)_GDL-associated radical SAM protein
VPVHVVWELTLACNLECNHCGSRAGLPRPNELSTAECLEVVEALNRLGTREVSLIGGEAYLRKDWVEIIRAVRSHGMYCAIQSGGRALTDARLEAAAEAGLQGVGISIDGLEELHDRLRGFEGSHAMAVDAMRRAKRLGLSVSANSQIGPETIEQLPEIMDLLIDAGATHWQIQLTVAMGNAVDNDELILQPYQLLELMPLLARLNIEGRRRGLLMIVGNNIGYFGPYETLLRGCYDEEQPFWGGCSAGQTAIGLESDGTVKGCPSLATVGYAGGNVRDLSIEEIWHTSEAMHFGRMRSVDDLWGFCRDCYYADVCRAGCTWTSDSLLGKPGNNPYCHYRALELEKRGLREKVTKVVDAPDAPFAKGRFELVSEPIPGANPPGAVPPSPRPPAWAAAREAAADPRHEGRQVPELDVCHACDYHIWPGETVCPHCRADVAAAAAEYAAEVERRRAVLAEVERLIETEQPPLSPL